MNSFDKIITIKEHSVVERFLDLILEMNHTQQLMLLEIAEEMSSSEKRASKRKSCRIPVRYVIGDRIFSDYITNISKNGIFIEIEKPFFTVGEILLDFKLDGNKEPLKITGEVAHVTRSGIGIKFDDVKSKLVDMIKMAVNQMEEMK